MPDKRASPQPRSAKLGRPIRSPVEIARVAVWFAAIAGGKQSGADLERKIRAAKSPGEMAHTSKWSKYRHGKSTPSQDLIRRADRVIRGSAKIFDHPLWDLTASPSMPPAELRSALLRLDEGVEWFLDTNHPENIETPFWLSPRFDHRTVIRHVLSERNRNTNLQVSYLERTALLAALIHDALNRQRQVQHFEAHQALAIHAANVGQEVSSKTPWLWKLEPVLLERWLQTEYRHPELRRAMTRYSAVDFGNLESLVRSFSTPPSTRPIAEQQGHATWTEVWGRWVVRFLRENQPVVPMNSIE